MDICAEIKSIASHIQFVGCDRPRVEFPEDDNILALMASPGVQCLGRGMEDIYIVEMWVNTRTCTWLGVFAEAR